MFKVMGEAACDPIDTGKLARPARQVSVYACICAIHGGSIGGSMVPASAPLWVLTWDLCGLPTFAVYAQEKNKYSLDFGHYHFTYKVLSTSTCDKCLPGDML